MVLQTAARLSPRSRKLGLTDAHNGLRVFNRRVADELNITMNGMGHASEFIALAHEKRWRVAEEPVEILYTDYSKSKGQPLLNGVNIVVDGGCEEGCGDELDPGAADRVRRWHCWCTCCGHGPARGRRRG